LKECMLTNSKLLRVSTEDPQHLANLTMPDQ
jgi:hypothetical protein